MGAVILLVVVGSTIWMGVDASARDWSDNKFARAPWQWVVGGLALWIVAFPAYLVLRGRVPRKDAGAGPEPATYGAAWAAPTTAPAPAAPERPSVPSRPSVPPPAPRG